MAKALRFIIVPKLAHPWYDEVTRGAREQAKLLSRELGAEVTVEFMPPSKANAAEQNAMLDKAAASRPHGIAVDLVDALDHMPAARQIREQSIPIVLFDSPSPQAGVTGVGNNYAEQGTIAAERLAKLLGNSGKVAVMRGFPTAPNHKERYDAQMAVLARHPGITAVDGGTDNDNIDTAREEAARVLAAHPDLRGYLCCNASGPIGIAAAVKAAGRKGQVKVVGIDGIRPILDAIKDGVIDSSSSTIPRVQGAMAILMLWQATLGGPLPRGIDTGIDVITQENIDRYLANA